MDCVSPDATHRGAHCLRVTNHDHLEIAVEDERARPSGGSQEVHLFVDFCKLWCACKLAHFVL